MKTSVFVLSLLIGLSAGAARAATRTVTLEVRNMSCSVCPLTVRKALGQVPGVQRVEVDYPNRTAIVQFDDAIVSEDTLTAATAAAGYPSTARRNAP